MTAPFGVCRRYARKQREISKRQTWMPQVYGRV